MTANPSTPTEQLSNWLRAFDAALQRADLAAAMAMFDADSYWRDMLTFTWNIKTMEGKAQIEAMLRETLARVKPSAWQVEGEATEAGGVTDGWVAFETAQASGRAHIRLKGDKCWTLLTTMVSLKGFEEKKSETRPRGVDHGVFQDRMNWAELKAQREAELGYAEQPYCLIVGGGQGGIGLGARLRRLGVPTIIVEKNKRPGRLLAQPLQVARAARPGLVRPHALPAVPGRLAGVLAQRQDRRLARDVHQGDGAELLGFDRMPERAL